jgi:hypothetical protein
VKFANQHDNQQFVIVGVAKEFQLNPRQVGGGFLYTYKLVNKIYSASNKKPLVALCFCSVYITFVVFIATASVV